MDLHQDHVARKRKAADMVEGNGSTGGESTVSRFQTLPPEIRNMIYRLVLVEDHSIAIRSEAASLPPDPALLHVDRQTRREASAIYYRENSFKVYINNFDAALYREWYTSSYSRRTARKEYVIRESRNWANLLDWLKAYYHGESGKPGPKRSGKPCISASLFSLVQRMKRHQKLSWPAVEANLEDVHQSLIAQDRRWL